MTWPTTAQPDACSRFSTALPSACALKMNPQRRVDRMRKRVERAAQPSPSGPKSHELSDNTQYINSDQEFVDARARLAVTAIFDRLMAVRHG